MKSETTKTTKGNEKTKQNKRKYNLLPRKKMISSEEIRQKREAFWLSKEHALVKPVSLIAPDQDKTVIFNVAGMQQL